MPAELTFASALVIGLFGSTHCAGMCGGIAAAFASARPVRNGPALIRLLAYNLGRISSYVFAGLLMGFAGAALAEWVSPHWAHRVAATVSAAFLAALALYVGGWWTGLSRLETYGMVVWRRLEPWARRLIPARNWYQALLLGMAWGWLPCGLVYTALVWSLASGSAVSGAVLMLGFGLGTLPTLVSIGMLGDIVADLRHRPMVRHVAGGFLLIAGAITLWLAFGPSGVHSHHMAMG